MEKSETYCTYYFDFVMLINAMKLGTVRVKKITRVLSRGLFVTEMRSHANHSYSIATVTAAAVLHAILTS